jgi:RIO kinase 3
MELLREARETLDVEQASLSPPSLDAASQPSAATQDAGAASSSSPVAPAASASPPLHAAAGAAVEGEDDEAFARRLQELEDRAAQLQAGDGSPAAASTADGATTTSADEDHALAMALQARYNEEHDRRIDDMERLANLSPSKVRVSLDRYRSPYPSYAPPRPKEHTEAEEEEHWEDNIEEAVSYDRHARAFRDADGSIVTKHNATVSGRRNRQRMEADFPIGFAAGDLKGGKNDDVRLSNRIYNNMRRFAKKEEKAAARLHEKKEHSTAELAMDKNTRLVIFKLLNAGILTKVNGAISTGKESVIFHGEGHIDPEDLDSEVVEVALKVFKTTLTEFTQRQQFLHGDRRFERRVGRQHARKLVKLWAEKELANLSR